VGPCYWGEGGKSSHLAVTFLVPGRLLSELVLSGEGVAMFGRPSLISYTVKALERSSGAEPWGFDGSPVPSLGGYYA
jgi:hypothetical protein